MARFEPDDPIYTDIYPVVSYEPAPAGETACRIVSHGSMGAGHIVDLVEAGEHWMIGHGTCQDHYADMRERAVLPKLASEAKLDGMVLRDLPIPCEVEITDAGGDRAYPVLDGVAELSFAHPGPTRVRVTSPRYLAAEFEVTAP